MESHPVGLRLVAVVVGAALATTAIAVFGPTVEGLVALAGCGIVVVLTVIDLERRIVPNRIVVPALAIALVVQTIREPSVEWVVSALAAGGFFFVLAAIYPAGLGMGDVKLAAFMGAWLGRDVGFALLVGSLLGAAVAVAILVTTGGSGRKTSLPYVPALATGAVAGLYFGEAALDAWLG